MKLIENLQSKPNKIIKRDFFLVYTIAFLVMATLVFSLFLIHKKSFIQGYDGVVQNLASLTYFGIYLRSIFFNLIHATFSLPLWDHNIGYGSDILTSLHINVFGDPLNLLSFFVPQKHTESLYNFLTIFKLYSAGFAFCLYCFRMKKHPMPTLIGSFVYVFCGYGIFAVCNPPFFLSPIVYLPLLLIGIEKVFHKEKPYLFICMVFISLISSFYYFYALSLLMFIYFSISIFSVYRKTSIKNILLCSSKLLAYYLLGILMACIIFIPNFITLLNSARNTLNFSTDLFYNVDWYKEFLFDFIAVYIKPHFEYYYWLKMGYPVISLLAIVLILIKYCSGGALKRQYKHLIYAFIILTLFALFPIGAKIFTRFSYITNRWIYGYSFLIAFITVTILPKMIALTKKEIKIISIFVLAFCILCLSMQITRTQLNFIACSILILSTCFLFFISKSTISDFKKYVLLLILIAINLIFNSYYFYLPNKVNEINSYVPSGEAPLKLTKNSQNSIKQLNDSSFFRFEENIFFQTAIINSTILTQLKGVGYYFSVANPYIFEFLEEIEHYTDKDVEYNDLDGRAMLSTLANVKYFIAAQDREMYLPFGYNKQVSSYRAFDGITYNAYQNEHTLPFGYTYSSYIPADIYKQLLPLEKQEALLQGVVLDERLSNRFRTLSKKDLLLQTQPLKYENVSFSKVMFTNGKIRVLGNNATATFTFKPVPFSETYVRFKNLVYLEKIDLTLIRVISSKNVKDFLISTPYRNTYVGKTNYMLNMGYSQTGETTITILFPVGGAEFSIDNLEFYALPIGKDYTKQVNALKEDDLEDVEIINNEIKGNINLTSSKILLLSIPYSKGWKAFVDKKPVPLLKANTMFMALPLDPGNHKIRLKYITPGLKLGAMVSFIGWLIFFVIVFKNKNRYTSAKKLER